MTALTESPEAECSQALHSWHSSERTSAPKPPWRQLGSRLAFAAGVLALFIAATAGLAKWFAGAGNGANGKKPPVPEFYRSFKDDPQNRDRLELIGPDATECVRFGLTGLRIVLPAGYDGPPGFFGERPDTGISIPVAIKGDFEITVGYEILREPEPVDAGKPQTRFTIDAGVDRARNIQTMLSRRVEPTGGKQFVAWYRCWNLQTDKDESEWKEFPASTKTGRLRLARMGQVVSYYCSEGPDAEFQLLQQYPFTDEDLEDVRITGSTGGPKAALDVLVTDVRVRATSLIQREVVNPQEAGGKVLLGLGAVAALVLCLTAAAVYLRHARMKTSSTGAMQPSMESTGSDTAAPTAAIRCSGCDKRLAVKAEFAGRRIKCPACGLVVRVPGA